jgi:hypothetical protein
MYPAVGAGTCALNMTEDMKTDTKTITTVLPEPSTPCQYDWIDTQFDCQSGKKT